MNKDIRKDAVREAKQQLILDAARKVFSDKGFHDARLEDIAEAAGFSKASLYNYYENKELIFLNLANREYFNLVEKIRERMDVNQSFASNLQVMLHTMFSAIGKYFPVLLTISQFQCQMVFNIETIIKNHQQLLADVHSQMSHMSQLFSSLIELGRRTGEITSSLSDRTITIFLGGLIRGTMMQWKVDGKMGDIDETVDQIQTFILNGVNKG